MLNENDLRPGDVIVDAVDDVWHVHEDGKIWCSEPGARISFETANGACGPFTYAPGRDPKRDENAGEWTRKDLPNIGVCQSMGLGYGSNDYAAANVVLDAVVDWLNDHHPKPAPDLLSSAAECVLDAEDRVRSAKAERDAAIARAEQVERERDGWRAAAERRGGLLDQSAPAVPRADIEAAVREGADHELADIFYRDITDAVWAKVSGSDPAVHVVRESDIAAVEVEKVGARIVCGGQSSGSPEASRIAARNYLQKATDCEAMARELEAIEVGQNVDPVGDVAHIISAGMFHKESTPELVREIAQEVVDYLKEENGG